MSDLTPEDEALLQSARSGGVPTADDHARVKRKLFAQVGIGIGAGTSAISTTSGAGAGPSAAGATVGTGGVLGVVAKVAVAVALVGGAVGTGLVIRGSTVKTSTLEKPAANAVQSVLPVSTALPTVRDSPTEIPTSTASDRTAPELSATTRAAAPVLAAPQSVTPAHGFAPPMPPRVVLEPEPTTPPRLTNAPPPSAAALAEATNPSAPPVVSTAVASAQTAPTLQAPAGPATVAAEAELLRQADVARKAGDAPRALALLDEHRARFPSGILVQEREAERVIVLCEMGRADEARAAATAFLHDWPRSPLAGRVRNSCGGS